MNMMKDIISDVIYKSNYKQEFADLLNIESFKGKEEQLLSEVFLFKQWFIQFSLRMFIKKNKYQEEEFLLQSILIEYEDSGIEKLNENKNYFNLETTLNGKYMDLINNRWSRYDEVIIKSTNQLTLEPIANIFSERLMQYRESELNIIEIDKFLIKGNIATILLNWQEKILKDIYFFEYHKEFRFE
ncbi:MAG: hypothetical protein COA97_03755 [Flavobacteriales bacterium]|nr:MAG: hypothetical protein COA97_03755 [Flavobacteriales bacterium]